MVHSHARIPAVVVVDDDAAVRNSLRFSLEIDGYNVLPYASAEALLKEEFLPDCACFVIDHNMPGINGLDLVIRLRDENVRTPIILITSAPPRNLVNRAIKLGVQIVEKPLLGEALLDQIQRLMRRHLIDSRP
jgi:FixJ family two-component response regulator